MSSSVGSSLNLSSGTQNQNSKANEFWKSKFRVGAIANAYPFHLLEDQYEPKTLM